MEAIFIYWAVSSIMVLGMAVELGLHKANGVVSAIIVSILTGWFFIIFYIGRLITLAYIINSEKIKSKKPWN